MLTRGASRAGRITSFEDGTMPVSIGGAVISPGDIVVGDEDGVVSFSQSSAPALLETVKAQIAREEATLLSIREGRYQGSYGKA